MVIVFFACILMQQLEILLLQSEIASTQQMNSDMFNNILSLTQGIITVLHYK